MLVEIDKDVMSVQAISRTRPDGRFGDAGAAGARKPRKRRAPRRKLSGDRAGTSQPKSAVGPMKTTTHDRSTAEPLRDVSPRHATESALPSGEPDPDADVDQARRADRRRVGLDEVHLVDQVLHAEEHLQPLRPKSRDASRSTAV